MSIARTKAFSLPTPPRAEPAPAGAGACPSRGQACRQLQAAVREGTEARFWYEPSEYEVELTVSAENGLRDHVVAGVLRVGPELDDVKFIRTR